MPRFATGSIEVPARFRSLVQDAYDLDDPGLNGPIADEVHRLFHRAHAAIATDMSQVEAADTRKEILPIAGRRAFWIRCNLSHARHQYCGVPTSVFVTPSLCARRQNMREIGLRRLRQPKSRHRVTGRAATVSG
jgi:hypothetical protein